MSTAEDRLEILIGRLLDGEISPGEQRVLDRELEQDGRARELLEQMRKLHECGREAIAQELAGGADPGEIFERAWRRSKGTVPQRIIRAGGMLRFPIGLAAGFILGLTLHFVLAEGSKSQVDIGTRPPVAKGNTVGADDKIEIPSKLERRIPDQVTREVEWYGFEDQAGNRWLIEGLREGMVKPASYSGGL